MTAADILVFAAAWASNPARVGAIAPSGSALAKLITSGISPESGPVVELGPGTGVFTRALLARGVRERDLILVECNSDFARSLSRQFPEARVLQMDAARLARAGASPGPPVGAVVSGLPLRTIPPGRVFSILSGAFSWMRPEGSFYQFTYGMRCPVPQRVLDRLGLRATRIGRTLVNVPPAAVYRITRCSRSVRPIRNPSVPEGREGAGLAELPKFAREGRARLGVSWK